MDIVHLEQRDRPGGVLLEELVVGILGCKDLDLVTFWVLNSTVVFSSKFTARPIVSRSKRTISR